MTLFTGPLTKVLDNLNRANENPLAGIWLGPIRTGHDQLQLVSNAAQGRTVAAVNESYDQTSFAADQESWCEIPTIPTGTSTDNVAVYTRIQNPASVSINFYRFTASLDTSLNLNTYAIDKRVLNVATNLLTVTGTQLANGDAILGRSVGTLLEIWSRHAGAWNLEGSTSDSDISGSGFIGFSIFETSALVAVIDNLAGGAFVPLVAPLVQQIGAPSAQLIYG